MNYADFENMSPDEQYWFMIHEGIACKFNDPDHDIDGCPSCRESHLLKDTHQGWGHAGRLWHTGRLGGCQWMLFWLGKTPTRGRPGMNPTRFGAWHREKP